MSTRPLSVVLLLSLAGSVAADESLSRQEAEAALNKAVQFFRQEVSVEGAYLWRYSADLEHREGEGKAGKTTAWVQPPGTPSVGMALLDAHRWTGDPALLEAARETALALVRGQLVSGGWDYRIEFAPQDRRRYAYRVDHPQGRVEKLRNTTTLDDNTTQAALRFLMRTDEMLKFGDQAIHDAAHYALDKLLAAQYPNGAWPQRFEGPADPAEHPVSPARYPESWPREYPAQNYSNYYTLNDNTLADTIATMFEAADIYGDRRYRDAAAKGGDFLLLAQMPDPQPAWSQQYNAQMQPAWARKFEPASITGGESQGALAILLDVYRRTGDKKYLEPFPKALAYLKKSRLPDGRLARFYELKTNRPLYFTREYELTYSDSDMPTHYSFKVSSRLESLERDYQRLLESGPPKPTTAAERTARPAPPRLTNSLTQQARQVIEQMDDRGAWVERGAMRQAGDDQVKQVIETRTFIKNLDTLSRFVAASK